RGTASFISEMGVLKRVARTGWWFTGNKAPESDRTQAESGWYGHCMQVLRWFLAYNGINESQSEEIVKNAVGGRFGSRIAPDVAVVGAVSSRFARGVGGIR
ncbi:hypothetical protein ABZ129_28755, partial [Streptomyces sp. NPDC006307]